MRTPPKITVQLIHLLGPMKGQIQEFTESAITFGRQADCNVRFPKDMTTISRLHAIIEREGNRFKLTDRSANGTFVNGKKITETYLKDGDVIMLTEGGPKVSFIAAITDAADEAPAPQAAAPAPPEPVRNVPLQPAPVQEPPQSTSESQTPEPAYVPPVQARPIPAPEPPRPAAPEPEGKTVQVPLMIQFGPTLRSYKEVPVTIGRNPSSGFVMTHPDIMDNHAQILFSQGAYRIRDLTGKNLIKVNGRTIEFEAVLSVDDVIHLNAGGPALRFLGEGRLAEHDEAPAENEDAVPVSRPATQKEEKPKGLKGFMDLFKK